MAEHKVQGGNMLLFIDPNGGTDYDLVVCLTSVGVSMSVGVVDASSACGPDKSPGALEISYTFEGQHLQDPDTGKTSGTDLRLLLNAEQTIGWKMSPETPEAGDEIQEGTGFLSELSSTYAFDSIGTFTGAIMPFGQPTITIFGASPFTIGQAYGGGYIAYIDGTGLHGLILNDTTPLSSMAWASTNELVGGTTAAYGDGFDNTQLILASTSGVGSAAELCANYTAGGFTDWFMPVLNELFYCGAYLPNLNDIWGSAEDNTGDPVNNAFAYDFTGFPTATNKFVVLKVYAARYF
jgi:hypothetical protein